MRHGFGLLAAMALGGCSGSTEPESDDRDPREPPPVIRHLGVDFEGYDAATGRAGGFDFHAAERVSGRTDRGFLEFGGLLTWADCPPGCENVGSYFFRLSDDAKVYAPIDGYVIDVRFSGHWNDHSVVLATKERREFWFVVIDHVLGVRVQPGQRVRAADWVASPGNGPLEIDLSSHDRRTHCMISYFDPATKAAWQQRARDLMDDWETFTGNPSHYDENAMVEPSCLAREVVHP
jgi:hypothetical protein